MPIALLRPTTGPLSDTFAEHAARYPSRVAVGNYAYCGQDFGRRRDHDTEAEDRRIVASHAGTIAVVWGDRDYGNYVLITSPLGFKTRYAHLARVMVSDGQTVTAGQQIGVMGDSGNAAGIHLHHELLVDGMQTDPAPYYVSAADWAASDLINLEEDDMPVCRVWWEGHGEHYLFAFPTRVTLSPELSMLKGEKRAFWDRTAARLNGGRVPDTLDCTPDGSWFMRDQFANLVAGMPMDFPLTPDTPYDALAHIGGGTAGPTLKQIVDGVRPLIPTAKQNGAEARAQIVK